VAALLSKTAELVGAMFKKSIVKGIGLRSVGFKFLPEILVKDDFKKVKTIHSYMGERKSGRSKVTENIMKFLRATYTLAMENG
jgi:hypothetical protein